MIVEPAGGTGKAAGGPNCMPNKLQVHGDLENGNWHWQTQVSVIDSRVQVSLSWAHSVLLLTAVHTNCVQPNHGARVSLHTRMHGTSNPEL